MEMILKLRKELNRKAMKIGIIFDMDGTLWDSAKQVAQAWSSVTEQKLGKSVATEDMYRVMGMPMDKLAMTLFPGHELSELMPVMEESGKVENKYLAEHGAVLYPDLIKTLKILAEIYPLYIVSNCQSGYIEAFLTHYHLDTYFQDYICYGTNGLQKGENIALISERNKLDCAVYVGDIQADYEAALAGGAEFIHAAYGFGSIDTKVPAIKAFSELPGLLQTMLSDLQIRSRNDKMYS